MVRKPKVLPLSEGWQERTEAGSCQATLSLSFSGADSFICQKGL